MSYPSWAENEIQRLERELRIEKLKNANSLANNLCSDCRDKQAGKPCLGCTVQTLQRLLESAMQRMDSARNTSDLRQQLKDALQPRRQT